MVARALGVAVVVSVLAVASAGASDARSPRRGGTIVLAAPASPANQEPACLNVIVPRCGPGLLPAIAGKVLESPFDVGPDLTWRPRLVSHVEFTRRPPFTLTYHIRPEARWSDNRPITSRDFLFTHEAFRTHGRRDGLHVTEVRSVRALNAKTVKVVLRSRFAGWRELFGSILPSHALRGEDLASVWTNGIDNPKTGAPIASGPFLVEHWQRGRSLTLRRNSRYWGPHDAYLDRLVFRFGVDSADLGARLRRGELDLTWGFPPGLVADLRRERGIRVVSTPGNSWDHFAIRLGPGGHDALKSKLVRRALAFAIDRVGLVRRLLTESNPRYRPLDNVVFLTQSRYYRPNWSGYRYSPLTARRLLERAGCRRGADGIYSCRGERLRLRFVTTGIPGGYRARLLELLPPQLRRAGIEIVPSLATAPALFGQIIPSGNFDLVLFAPFAGPDPAPKPFFGCGAPLNVTGYCQRLVTRELDQATRILSAEQQARVLNRADAQIARDVPVLPFVQMPQSAAFRTSVRNFALSLNAGGRILWNAENWWLVR